MITIPLQSCKLKGNRLTLALYKSEMIKEDSESSIVKKYGKPQELWFNRDGNKVLSYSYAKLNCRFFQFQ